MSINYGCSEGLAVVLPNNDWVDIWNKNHPNNIPVESPQDVSEVDFAFTICDDGDCEEFDIYNSTDPRVPSYLKPFGLGLQEFCNEGIDLTQNTMIVKFAPKPPNYFKAPYNNIDEVIQDIINETETFTQNDYDYIKNHLVYTSIITFG